MTDQGHQGYTFNWHTLDEHDDYEGFLRWMFVNLVTESRGDGTPAGVEYDHLINRVIDATDGAMNVTLTIQANGIELNAEHFVRSVQRNMRWHAHQAAFDELRSRTDVSELLNVADQVQTTMTDQVRRLAHSLGIELNDEGDVI
jgi:hypothetical protein